MEYGTKNKLRHKDNFKFYWFRLTEAATNNLLADGGSKLIDPDLKNKYTYICQGNEKDLAALGIFNFMNFSSSKSQIFMEFTPFKDLLHLLT